VNPRNQREPPVGGVEADDARAQMVEGDSGHEQRLGEGGIVAVGGGETEEHGQAGAATAQGMDAIAAQEGGGMMGGGVAMLGIGVGPTPRLDGRAVNNKVARRSRTAGWPP